MSISIDDFEINDSTLIAVLESLYHDVLLISTKGIIKYVNSRAKSNIFKNIDFSNENTNEISEVFENLFQNYQIGNIEFLQKAILETKSPTSFVVESDKISIKDDEKTKYYEVSTHPVFSKEKGLIGRIWQFRDRTITENIENMKTEFLSIASHQLRTPIASIRGYMSMILDGDFGEVPNDLSEPLHNILIASTKMNELVNDLLNISRLDKGLIIEKLSEANINKLITEVCNSVSSIAEQKQIEIVTEMNETNQIVLVTDESKISESLKNLIQNSIKYSNRGSKVYVNTKKLASDRVLIEVIDSGVGIPDDQKEKIFTKFFRADNVLTENFEGTGLGLYYVKKSIESLGGSVGFESEIGKGSRFFVEVTNTNIQN